MKFAGYSSIVIGVLMLAQWGFFLAAGQVPEVTSAPIALAFHLVAEAATALGLIAAGIASLRGIRWARAGLLTAMGMLIYTVIVSPGYFAQGGSWELVMMFVVLLAIAVVNVVRVGKNVV